jgi:hypothetical protein
MSATKFKKAIRSQVSLLAPLEKRTLISLAHRAPNWIGSGHLTVLGLSALLGAGVSYWYVRYHRTACCWLSCFLHSTGLVTAWMAR